MHPFMSGDVAWVRARYHAGLSFQSGWLVVRPGWVAFLPSAPSAHLVAEVAWALSSVAPAGRCPIRYDLEGARQRGPAVFDATVLAWARSGGRVWSTDDGDIVRSSKLTLFRADEKTFIHCEARFPEPLIAGWRQGKVRFDARETAKLFAILTAFPAAIGALGGVVAYFEGESAASIGTGVGFWWALVLFAWCGFLVLCRRAGRHRRRSMLHAR